MHETCPFCLKNKRLNTSIIAESDGAFLIEASSFPGCFLIIPKIHAEAISDLPATWWQDFSQMFKRIPVGLVNFNVSLNVGEAAGQTVKHLHFWIIPRSENEPATGKGLVTLISAVNKK